MLNWQVKFKHGSVGFTLVELMVTLAVAAIVATVAIPSFMSMIASNRVTAGSNEMVTALNLGKSEAIRSGHNTILCKSANGSTCGGKWSDGWILFSDVNNDTKRQDNEQIITVHAAPESSLGFVFKDGNYVEFSPTGHTNEDGHFCFRNSNQDSNSRAVYITKSGRIRTQVVTGATACAA